MVCQLYHLAADVGDIKHGLLYRPMQLPVTEHHIMVPMKLFVCTCVPVSVCVCVYVFVYTQRQCAVRNHTQ